MNAMTRAALGRLSDVDGVEMLVTPGISLGAAAGIIEMLVARQDSTRLKEAIHAVLRDEEKRFVMQRLAADVFGTLGVKKESLEMFISCIQ